MILHYAPDTHPHETQWERAGDGCSCWVNPNPFTHYGIVEPGDALEPDPRCKKHFSRWQLACINWGADPAWDAPKAIVYCLVNGQAMSERYFPTWSDGVGWLNQHGAALETWARFLAEKDDWGRDEWESARTIVPVDRDTARESQHAR